MPPVPLTLGVHAPNKLDSDVHFHVNRATASKLDTDMLHQGQPKKLLACVKDSADHIEFRGIEYDYSSSTSIMCNRALMKLRGVQELFN